MYETKEESNKLKKSGKTPVVIDFELSNKCNERCVFCRDEKGNIFDVLCFGFHKT